MKNESPTAEKYYLLLTASYINVTIKNKEDLVNKNAFGGKVIELAGNEECEISFELIVETYLDRIKQYQVSS